MRNLTPCPSPRNTNLERLYLVRMPYRGPQMAMDQEMDPPDISNSGGDDDLTDKVHQLLDGKVDPADIEALIQLIMGGEAQASPTQPPDIAQDALLRRRVAQGAQARARLGMEQRAALERRFPAIKHARVV